MQWFGVVGIRVRLDAAEQVKEVFGTVVLLKKIKEVSKVKKAQWSSRRIGRSRF